MTSDGRRSMGDFVDMIAVRLQNRRLWLRLYGIDQRYAWSKCDSGRMTIEPYHVGVL